MFDASFCINHIFFQQGAVCVFSQSFVSLWVFLLSLKLSLRKYFSNALFLQTNNDKQYEQSTWFFWFPVLVHDLTNFALVTVQVRFQQDLMQPHLPVAQWQFSSEVGQVFEGGCRSWVYSATLRVRKLKGPCAPAVTTSQMNHICICIFNSASFARNMKINMKQVETSLLWELVWTRIHPASWV